ncbi:pyridoxal phosphate-dependent aminotransferase [Nocardia sp. NBC_01503]|uniref:pyridoxal phosphate-dependent aminotransferase n=1 Tax=Nocardia sp. NBC_01503 TaxID=2975997 RepID=UPI002E7B42E6|nr:pyridoxal phosphate-dependent aminotransferase [Nocardia sp. NBC_01503]WTL36397.1 pyridoxal phosphate-dependent aminotransferase [Nocardia sp. NBC_01503]
MLDFAVNVQGSGPPEWLRERLAGRLAELGRYPDAGEERAVREAVAARHGRRAEEVLLLAGAAEGFAMLPRLGSTLAAVIHPSFTEPELALREAGVPVARVVLDAPYTLESVVAQENMHRAGSTDGAGEPGDVAPGDGGRPPRPAVGMRWKSQRHNSSGTPPGADALSADVRGPAASDGVPEAADLVVVGNPTNPTSVLHPAESLLALRRPGRIVVVDEAFADAVVGETESLAAESYPDVLVLRSLTKTWALAGLRCGYFLGAPELLARLHHGRAHWALGTLQLEAIAATCSAAAVAESQRMAESIASQREAMIPRLRVLGIDVHEPAHGPFLLIRVPDAELLRKKLADKGIAVRRGDTFPGLETGFLRLAVRPAAAVDQLVAAIAEVGL